MNNDIIDLTSDTQSDRDLSVAQKKASSSQKAMIRAFRENLRIESPTASHFDSFMRKQKKAYEELNREYNELEDFRVREFWKQELYTQKQLINVFESMFHYNHMSCDNEMMKDVHSDMCSAWLRLPCCVKDSVLNHCVAFAEALPPAADKDTPACPICLLPIEEGEFLIEMTGCGHSYHVACIEHWLRLNPTCPLCKASICCSK